MIGALRFLARHGRVLLVLGLLAGVALPALAEAMRPLIGPLVVFLLFLAVLRLGPEGLRRGMADLRGAVRLALMLQLAAPLLAIAVLGLAGVLAHPLALGVVVLLAAAPITGSPNIAQMSGADPAPALRQLVVGTALLPLTALPVFWLMPAFGSPGAVLATVARLLFLIALAGGLALALRHWRLVSGSAPALAAMDGLAALVLGIVVIGLMSAVGPALAAGGAALWPVLALVLAINFALQIGVALALRRRSPALAPALGIVAGNRNIALFLGVLPADLVQALLLFIGCYQVPMYLTPLLLERFYRRIGHN